MKELQAGFMTAVSGSAVQPHICIKFETVEAMQAAHLALLSLALTDKQVVEDDAAELARMRESNIWHNLQDIVPTLKAAKAGEWHWYANTRCKYIELRIDMRDLGCIVMDRYRERITPSMLAAQAGITSTPTGDSNG